MKEPLSWMGRPISDKDDAAKLHLRSALLEFHHGMPRHEAEQSAHNEYVKEQHLQGAAFHLAGMRAAHAADSSEEATKHHAMYSMHCSALGLPSEGSVPQEVVNRMNAPERDKAHAFKSHPSDVHISQEPTSIANELNKSESVKRCAHKLGERRCMLYTRSPTGHCYHHSLTKSHPLYPYHDRLSNILHAAHLRTELRLKQEEKMTEAELTKSVQDRTESLLKRWAVVLKNLAR